MQNLRSKTGGVFETRFIVRKAWPKVTVHDNSLQPGLLPLVMSWNAHEKSGS